MTDHTTHITALIPAADAEDVHDALAAIVTPAGQRHFSTAPTHTVDGDDYVYISTVATPEVAEAYQQVAETHPVDLMPSGTPYATITYPPLPDAGEQVESGQIYTHGEGLVMARQNHTRTNDDPADVLALFIAYRHPEKGLGWIPAETVEVGTLREHDGRMYRARQGHTTQDDYRPPDVPALWHPVEAAADDEDIDTATDDTGDDALREGADYPEWQAGVDVSVGEVYTYDGATYRVVQAHTTQVGWEPPTVAALWTSVVDVNTAPTEELQSLEGVGPSLAQKIIDGRPYDSVDDLTRVSGVSQSMVDGWGDEVVA